MRKILTMAVMTVRAAMRSRIVLILLAMLMLVIFGLPLAVHGDGTLSGHVQILLTYTLGFATVLLSIQAIWIGCAGIASEIEDRQIQLVVTKPVRSMQIWLGKYLGILFLNALLLVCAGSVTYGLLRWTTRPSELSQNDQARLRDEILIARRRILPVPIAVDEPARNILEQRRRRGDLPPNVPEATVYEAIKERLRGEANSVPTGLKRRWTFRVPSARDDDQPMLLQYKLATARDLAAPVSGIWLAGPNEDPSEFRKEVVSASGGVYTVAIPRSAAGKDGRLIVEYGNINPVPVTVHFPGEEGMALFVYEDSFEMNFLRALLTIFLQLAFLAAVGLAAGTAFSMPVAAFISGWIVLLLSIGDHLEVMAGKTIFFSSHGSPVTTPGFRDHFFRIIFRGLDAVVGPLRGANPLELLATGELVGWSSVLAGFVIKVLVYSGVLMMLSSWILSRREVGLQQ